MDEFQDTNGQQARLIELIRPPDRFYAVGDINQSIFGFRHAEPAGFTAYRDDVAARGRHLVQLVDNFRSRAEILRAVETVTAGTPGIEDRPLVAGPQIRRRTGLLRGSDRRARPGGGGSIGGAPHPGVQRISHSRISPFWCATPK